MKAPTSLITLGTSAGPSLTPGRAQTSHLLTVNGTYYVVDAGDGVARRMARAGADVREVGKRWESFSSPTITMTILQASGP